MRLGSGAVNACKRVESLESLLAWLRRARGWNLQGLRELHAGEMRLWSCGLILSMMQSKKSSILSRQMEKMRPCGSLVVSEGSSLPFLSLSVLSIFSQ